MKRRSSACFLVSMFSFPVAAVPKDSPKQIMNRHYLFDMCSATT